MGYILGVDLGQTTDPTALVVLERRVEDRVWAARFLQRLPLGVKYPEIVERVRHLLSRPPLRGNCHLVFDETGVGRPVGDLLRQVRMNNRIIGITITGGDTVSYDATTSSFRVPKRDLVSAVQLLLQQRRLKIARDLPHSEMLVEELMNFRVHISEAGHDSYSAWRSGDHDDLVLAVSLAAWVGQKFDPLPPGPPEAGPRVSESVEQFFEGLEWASPNPDRFIMGDYGAHDLEQVRNGWQIRTGKFGRPTGRS